MSKRQEDQEVLVSQKPGKVGLQNGRCWRSGKVRAGMSTESGSW